MMMQFEVTRWEHLTADEATLWKIASVVATALFQYIFLNLNLKSTEYLALAQMPGVARDSIRNKGTQEIKYGII
jgi:hypothetical protein